MKIFFFLLILLTLNISYAQSEAGASISYTGINTFGIDVFGGTGDGNRYHLGVSFQSNNTFNKVVNERKSNYGLTKLDSGDYIFTVDAGYSRVLFQRLTLNAEITYGLYTEYTNYQDRRFTDDGYSLITKRESTFGVGINIGCYIYKKIEPFIGVNTLKKISFGIRFSM